MRRIIVLIAAVAFTATAQTPTFPNGCVDCHAKVKEGDMRITTLMAPWTKAVPPKTLAKFPKAMALKGKHPPVTGKDIPGACLKCHSGASKTIPAMAPLIHILHFTGEPNQFVKKFGADCRHCHKFEAKTAVMKLPSGPEK